MIISEINKQRIKDAYINNTLFRLESAKLKITNKTCSAL